MGPIFYFVSPEWCILYGGVTAGTIAFFIGEKMSSEIVFAIIVTSIATYSSRFLGMLTSLRINENSRIYRWFNCIAYSTLTLISRILIFPNGVLMDTNYFIGNCNFDFNLNFFISKKNLVYPTIFSAIILTLMSSYYS